MCVFHSLLCDFVSFTQAIHCYILHSNKTKMGVKQHVVKMWNSHSVLEASALHFSFFNISTFQDVFMAGFCGEKCIYRSVNRERSVISWITAFQIQSHYCEEATSPHRSSICLSDGNPPHCAGVVYHLPPSHKADEDMRYFKWLIMAVEAKRLDENPILPPNHQRQVWSELTLTQCDVLTTAKWLNVRQWLLLKCFVGRLETRKPKGRERLNMWLQSTWEKSIFINLVNNKNMI